MRKPRAVTLTPTERRALRVIEQALTEADPDLALLMTEAAATGRLRRLVRRTSRIYLTTAVMVFLFGLMVNDQGILGCGIVMLMMAVVVVPWAVEIQR